MRFDPRHYQIAVLSVLLGYGMLALDFEVSVGRTGLILASVLGCQALGSKMTGARFEWRSALISGLSLCLLCRTNEWWLAVLAGVIAIGSKFVLRVSGKHLFNPTNLALVLLLLAADGAVWVSPGQWGNVAFFAFLMACLGGLVVMRAGRSDVALTFLAAWIALLVGRSFWLHEPMTIPLHRLQNGALLLFAFFMISDPRTTPDSRAGRMVFAVLVAVGGWWWQFLMFGTNGPLWALAACSLLTPLIDFLLPARRYEWSRRSAAPGLQLNLASS
ncbi:MAG: RnfABCDGE type electron transport complex subunit D [Prosthecobacter sp.]|nr:RnfABCDGE type electron transport complex subunit D [Prosthecobacter sp.]